MSMTKEEIIAAIRQTPLDEDDITEIMTACTRVTLGNALIGAGMDLLADKVRDDA